MKLLVIVLCLLSERYLTHQFASNRFGWFAPYCERLFGLLPKKIQWLKNPWVLLSLVVIPWVVIVAVLLGGFKSYLLGFVGFLMQLGIFYYCIGPDNVFYPASTNTKKQAKDAHTATHYLAAVNNQLFGVVFWYIALGPLAVLVYRLISLCQNETPLRDRAVWITNILDWVPARLTVVLYLLVGNFQQGFQCLLQRKSVTPAENNALLSEVGLLAVGPQEEKIALPAAQGLVEHAMVLCLVLLALFTLVSWL